MIQIKNLEVSAGDTDIIQWISLEFEPGKNYCLLGKNGSGKSTLSSILMGHPKYKVKSGSIEIEVPVPDGAGSEMQDLVEMEPDEKSKAGVFLSFQNIPEITGVKLSEYLRTIFNISAKNDNEDFTELSPFMFKRYIKPMLEELHIDEKFLDRDLNVGFSGGEKRKIEILQMKLIWPKYIILDEIDSGLDLDAFKVVASMLSEISSEENSIIIITHYFSILEYIEVDQVFVIKDGKIVKEGGPDLAEEVKEKGFSEM